MPAPPRFASLPPSSPSPGSPWKEGRHSWDYPPFSPSSALRHPRPHPPPPSLPSYAQVLGALSPANIVSQGPVVWAQGLVVSQGRPLSCPRRLRAILGSGDPGSAQGSIVSQGRPFPCPRHLCARARRLAREEQRSR
jgi:hypothetical protein